MQLQKYDIILCKNSRNPISALIRFITKDIYSHSEIYIGNFHIIDDMPNGVKIREVDRRLGDFDAFRYKGTFSQEQVKKIDEFLSKALNSRYDYIELFLQLFKKPDKRRNGKYICISLIIEAFRYAGIDVGTWKQGFKQISENKNFTKIN